MRGAFRWWIVTTLAETKAPERARNSATLILQQACCGTFHQNTRLRRSDVKSASTLCIQKTHNDKKKDKPEENPKTGVRTGIYTAGFIQYNSNRGVRGEKQKGVTELGWAW